MHGRYPVAMASLSRADVAHVAHLARLGLTDEELARLEGQLNHILDQYTVLTELSTDDIPPTAQTIEVETILREDLGDAQPAGRGRAGGCPGTIRRLLRGPRHPRRRGRLRWPTRPWA